MVCLQGCSSEDEERKLPRDASNRDVEELVSISKRFGVVDEDVENVSTVSRSLSVRERIVQIHWNETKNNFVMKLIS